MHTRIGFITLYQVVLNLTSCAAIWLFIKSKLRLYTLWIVQFRNKIKSAVSTFCAQGDKKHYCCRFVKFLPIWNCLMKVVTVFLCRMCCGPGLIMFIHILKMWRNFICYGPANG
jgi:hypothetical protein